MLILAVETNATGNVDRACGFQQDTYTMSKCWHAILAVSSSVRDEGKPLSAKHEPGRVARVAPYQGTAQVS